MAPDASSSRATSKTTPKPHPTRGKERIGGGGGGDSRSNNNNNKNNNPVVYALLTASMITAIGAIARAAGGRNSFSFFRGDAGVVEDLLYHRVGRTPRWSQQGPHFLDAGDDHHHPPPPRFERTRYTFDSFVVAGGVDLAGFGLDGDPRQPNNNKKKKKGDNSAASSSSSSSFFELFEDFDLTRKLRGNETWIELLEHRRDATHPSLSFYVDKVAFKRYLVGSYADLRIEFPKSYLLRYGSELRDEVELVRTAEDRRGRRRRRRKQQEQQQEEEDPAPRGGGGTGGSSAPPSKDEMTSLVADELLQRLPTDTDYAAKPTHLSCSGGVWLVHIDGSTNTTYVGNGKKTMKPYVGGGDGDPRSEIAGDLSANLNIVQEKCGRTVVESQALRHVRPGIVVEERFTQPPGDDDDDDESSLLKGGMEFKVFTIWGRAWLTVWRPGTDGVRALFFRNGTSLAFDPPKKKTKKTKEKDPGTTTTTNNEADATPSPPPVELPAWIDWEKVIAMGETLGRNKDMFRTDIFVGRGSGGAAAADGSSGDSVGDVRYAVSETEIHPTPLRGFETVFEEAGRLWLAGYHFRLSRNAVPNTEVPWDFFPGRR